MTNVVVFDFDKTLTYKDSLRELFNEEMKGLKFPLRFYYLLLMVLSKFKFISVRKEKECMIKVLFNSDLNLFKRKCIEQAKVLRLNPIFSRVVESITSGKKVIILSASSMFLLEEVFKEVDVEIIGTTFCCENNIIKKIDRHPFASEKFEVLTKYGIKEVEEMFYDSHNDECLIPLCNKWNKVKNGVIIEQNHK